MCGNKCHIYAKITLADLLAVKASKIDPVVEDSAVNH